MGLDLIMYVVASQRKKYPKNDESGRDTRMLLCSCITADAAVSLHFILHLSVEFLLFI